MRLALPALKVGGNSQQIQPGALPDESPGWGRGHRRDREEPTKRHQSLPHDPAPQRWSGTFESDNWAVRPFVMTLTQANGRVDGTWASDPWTGTLSGLVDARTFSGQMTMNAPGTTATCTGTASVAGPVGSGLIATLRWTSVGVSGNCTGIPINIAINVQRR
jgi:hypothetical protein